VDARRFQSVNWRTVLPFGIVSTPSPIFTGAWLGIAHPSISSGLGFPRIHLVFQPKLLSEAALYYRALQRGNLRKEEHTCPTLPASFPTILSAHALKDRSLFLWDQDDEKQEPSCCVYSCISSTYHLHTEAPYREVFCVSSQPPLSCIRHDQHRCAYLAYTDEYTMCAPQPTALPLSYRGIYFCNTEAVAEYSGIT